MEAMEDNEALIKKITSEVVDDIGKDIENKVIGVGAETRDIGHILDDAVKRKKKKSEKMKPSGKWDFQRLEEMRKSKLVELKEIERNESILKKSQVLNHSMVSRSLGRLEMSRFTDDEVREIKEIMKRQKQFEKSLRIKQKRLEEWIEEKKVEDKDLRRKEKTEKCEIRKKELEEQRTEFDKKRQERKFQYEQEIKKLKELKDRKYLYHELEKEPRVNMKQELLQKINAYEQEKQRKKMTVCDIEIHEKQYMDHKREKDQKRERQLEDSMGESTPDLPFVLSKFYYKMLKDEKEQVRMDEWERNVKEHNISKKREYSKHVKELFLPKISKASKVVIKDEENYKKGLRFDEEHQLGNQYMKSAHNTITKEQLQIAKDKKSVERPEEHGGYSAFYKNYLKDLQKNRSSQDLNFQAFQSVLDNSTMTEQQKLKKAIKMIQMKENHYSLKSKDSELVDSIKSKMLVLNQMIR